MIKLQRTITSLTLVAVSVYCNRQVAQSADGVYHAGDHFGRLAFSPKGDRLADGSKAGEIRIWDLKTRKVASTLRLNEKRRVPRYMAWSPDGKRIAVAGFGMPTAIVDVASGRREAHLQKTRELQPGNVNGLGWHPDGGSLYVSFPRTVVHWNPSQSNIPVVLAETSKTFYGWHGMLNSRGSHFALVDEHGRFHLWDLNSAATLIERHYKPCCRVYLAWSPDDSMVAISSGTRVELLDPQSGETLRRIPSPDDSSIIAWSPDGQTIAVAHGQLDGYSSTDRPDKPITLFNSRTGQLLRTINSGVKNIEALAWSRDSRHLATTGSSKTWEVDEKANVRVTSNPAIPVTLWNVSTGKRVGELSP